MIRYNREILKVRFAEIEEMIRLLNARHAVLYKELRALQMEQCTHPSGVRASSSRIFECPDCGYMIGSVY